MTVLGMAHVCSTRVLLIIPQEGAASVMLPSQALTAHQVGVPTTALGTESVGLENFASACQVGRACRVQKKLVVTAAFMGSVWRTTPAVLQALRTVLPLPVAWYVCAKTGGAEIHAT